MAKSSKVEDYWRQHNIEGLFKDLTRTLIQRMPSDPILAIVQHLQKKFPKSFKTSTDDNNDVGIVSKTMASNLQLRSIISPRSDINNESTSDADTQRPAFNQSQVSGITTLPTVGSAFNNLLKQDLNSSDQTAPELNFKNLVLANRLGQKVVKLRKDIQSDRDILDEELIRPTKTKTNILSTTNENIAFDSGDLQQARTQEEPSSRQLIKYKQNIHTAKDRRLHQEKLAEFAKQAREKEQILHSDPSIKSGAVQEQQKFNDGYSLSSIAPETSSTKIIQKPIVKSKEEEEILNDENIFQPGGQRRRERYRNRLPTSRSNTPRGYKRYMRDFHSSMTRGDANSIPMLQFGVCKVCGNMLSNDEKQAIIDSQQVFATQTARPFEAQPSVHSVESTGDVVDDWFESPSDVSGIRQVLPWTPDYITPQPVNTNPFQRNIFQPINDNNDIVQHRSLPATAPLIITDDKTKSSRSSTPRMSESDTFVRTPEPKGRRSSSSRSITSPVTKKHQTDTLAVTNYQLSKTMPPPSHSRPTLPSPLTTTLVPTTERRMSNWSVCEHSPDDSDDN